MICMNDLFFLFSLLWSFILYDIGSELEIELADDPNLALQSYGSYHYDALILFAPKVQSLGGSLNATAVMEFVNCTTSNAICEIATECGADFDGN